MKGDNTSPQGTWGRERSLFPKRAIGIALILTMMFFVTLGWLTWQSYRGMATTLTADFRLQELRGTIAHFDEVLTMSARMCAATGDMKWEDRYRKYVPRLDRAIKQARDLAPEIFISQAAARTDEANVHLVAMEDRAFELVRSGNLEQAEAMLDSDEYAQQKRYYAMGMAELLAGLEQRSQTNLSRHRRSLYFTVALVGVSMPMVVFIWLNVLRLTRAGLAEHKHAEQERPVDRTSYCFTLLAQSQHFLKLC